MDKPIDIVVANAGMAVESAPAHETSLELWNRMLNVNLTGAFLSVKPALAAMRRARVRPDRVHCLDGGAEGIRLCGALCGRQAWRDRPDACARA